MENNELEQLPVPPLTDHAPWGIWAFTLETQKLVGKYRQRGEAEVQLAWFRRHTLDQQLKFHLIFEEVPS